MARPRWVRKPIWGFGPVGWVLAAVLAAMIVALVAGVDLRHQFLRLILSIAGVKAMIWFVVWWLHSASLLLYDAAFGSVTLCVTLLLAHLSPRRVARWKYVLLVVWCVLLPVAVGQVRLYTAPMGRGYDWRLSIALLELAVTVPLLWLVMHDRRTSLAAAGSVLMAQSMALCQERFPGVWVGLPGWCNYAPTGIYHAGLLGALAWWVVRSRGEHRKEAAGGCAVCGYSLIGLRSLDGVVACPECGAAARSPSAAVIQAPIQNPC